ncbi:hypothetical protein FN846DRAFT_902249 [Sphaerosporella brunnea]|uniref:Uncharacterized protein n=1 Tax=Sphaerosporella brunnea TaxID=1250544 RepID=A0A5J5FB64_9PEZI|nr:hypothetical protein FN846DRAFT_902249 [Sphaerosporella brunnea]
MFFESSLASVELPGERVFQAVPHRTFKGTTIEMARVVSHHSSSLQAIYATLALKGGHDIDDYDILPDVHQLSRPTYMPLRSGEQEYRLLDAIDEASGTTATQNTDTILAAIYLLGMRTQRQIADVTAVLTRRIEALEGFTANQADNAALLNRIEALERTIVQIAGWQHVEMTLAEAEKATTAANSVAGKQIAETRQGNPAANLNASKHAKAPLTKEKEQDKGKNKDKPKEVQKISQRPKENEKEKDKTRAAAIARPRPACKQSTFAAVVNQGADTTRQDGTWTVVAWRTPACKGPRTAKLTRSDKPRPENARGVIFERENSVIPDIEDYNMAVAANVTRALMGTVTALASPYSTAAQVASFEDIVMRAARRVDPGVIGSGPRLEWLRVKVHGVPVRTYFDHFDTRRADFMTENEQLKIPLAIRWLKDPKSVNQQYDEGLARGSSVTIGSRQSP